MKEKEEEVLALLSTCSTLVPRRKKTGIVKATKPRRSGDVFFPFLGQFRRPPLSPESKNISISV